MLFGERLPTGGRVLEDQLCNAVCDGALTGVFRGTCTARLSFSRCRVLRPPVDVNGSPLGETGLIASRWSNRDDRVTALWPKAIAMQRPRGAEPLLQTQVPTLALR
jgi:hypothetical protein